MPKAPHPRTPTTDPSKSQRVGQSPESEAERRRREQRSQKDVDPIDDRGRDPRADGHEEGC